MNNFFTNNTHLRLIQNGISNWLAPYSEHKSEHPAGRMVVRLAPTPCSDASRRPVMRLGHWRRMRGTLAVVKDVEAYLASRAAAAPKVTEWKVEELAPDLTSAGASRNAARGKEIFTKLACASCHKLGAEGVNYGPELTDVLKRYNNDRAELLRQIIEPSLVITNRYRNYEFELKDGESVFGMIVKEEGEAWTIQTGPSDALIQTLKKSDVQNQRPQNSSLMPLALLNTLSKEEILDLLAYLEKGGNPTPHKHEH